jgi:hypothetical protein
MLELLNYARFIKWLNRPSFLALRSLHMKKLAPVIILLKCVVEADLRPKKGVKRPLVIIYTLYAFSDGFSTIYATLLIQHNMKLSSKLTSTTSPYHSIFNGWGSRVASRSLISNCGLGLIGPLIDVLKVNIIPPSHAGSGCSCLSSFIFRIILHGEVIESTDGCVIIKYTRTNNIVFSVTISNLSCSIGTKGHFAHKTESPWPLHSKHSLVEKAEPVQVRCFTLRLRTNGVCECKMDVKSTWIPTWHRMDHVSWSLGLFSKTISWR